MESLLKLAALSENMLVEVEEETAATCLLSQAACSPASSTSEPARADNSSLPITTVAMPNGQRMPILKTVLTSVCEKNCFYCAFRAGRDFRRHTFRPDEMARAFLDLYKGGAVKGIFLSSGVAGGAIHTQDRLLDTADIMRNKLGFKGYLHLKIMPGAERAQVERAMQLADRVSVNLEAPNTERLSHLAPQKVFIEDLLQPLRWVEEIRKSQPAQKGWKGRWPSTTTQFVAGGSGENDLELLNTTFYLTRKLRLARVYYSGFRPVAGTPLENQPPINPWRQNRLYQASFLIRDYAFDLEDMPFNGAGELPLDVDPKLAWARIHLGETPIEINRADLHELLRIPGIGPQGARAILSARRTHKIRSISDLKALGIRTSRAVPFILLDGYQPARQMVLF
jgi:predicted DNA-binding helix-hairpin-helix protein